jgi:DNA polymerase III subunit gamma/tau
MLCIGLNKEANVRDPSSISGRPKNLDQLIGQAKKVKLLRGLQKKRPPIAWMFVGGTGSGKTTIAQILALSLQCSHQEKFGMPCKICRRQSNLPIFEIDCGSVTGVDDIKKYIRASEHEILGKGKKRVYILDECQMLSKHAQSALLKPTEKKNSGNVIWIFCTTDPESIRDTIRSRCKIITLKPFNRDDVLAYTTRLLKASHSKLSAEELADALVENNITSGRLVAQAVDSYVAGESVEDAADVDSISAIKSKALVRAVGKGDWGDTAALLRKADTTNIRKLRGAIAGYLRSILLDSSEIDDRSKAIAEAIKRLVYVGSADEGNQLAALSAELLMLCEIFGNYQL